MPICIRYALQRVVPDYYEFEYACCPMDNGQSVLTVRCRVTNEGERILMDQREVGSLCCQ